MGILFGGNWISMKYFKHLLLGLFFLSFTQKTKANDEQLTCEPNRMGLIAQAAHQSLQNATNTPNAEIRAGQKKRKEITIFLYVQARNNLAPYSIQNLRAITNIGESPYVNLIIQWEQPRQKGVFRYVLEGHQLVEKFRNLDDNNIGNPLERVTKGFQWAIENYPSKQVFFWGWNHGLGGVEIPWGNPLRLVTYTQQHNLMQRVAIDGLTHISDNHHRGVMFDEEARVYMTTGELLQLGHNMRAILGRKLDMIGFDACYMSMLEIWYLLSDCAHVGVGSSDIELATGWNYLGIMQALQKSGLSAKDVGKVIVSSYRQFYKGKTPHFTQSAIKLKNTKRVKENLDIISQKLSACMNSFGNTFKHVLIKARKATLEFANPMFIDLRSFYHELCKQLNSTHLPEINQSNYQQSPALHHAPGLYVEENDSQEIKKLKHLLHDGIKLIEDSIISHTASKHLTRSSGFAIYFPCRDFYDSYTAGVFSHISEWPGFVKNFFKMVNEREYSHLM